MVASSSDKDVNESTRNAINRLLTNVLSILNKNFKNIVI